jgi:hypothetical protein
MALFYFNIDDGEQSAEEMGVELADVAAARKEAAVLAGEMLRDRPDQFWDARAWRVAVSDAAGLTLFTIDVGGQARPLDVSLH